MPRQGAMEFPQFPNDFSVPARANVIAAEVRSSRALNGPKQPQSALLGGVAAGRTGWVMQYIVTVFASFAHEACELGRAQQWAVDTVDRESRESSITVQIGSLAITVEFPL